MADGTRLTTVETVREQGSWLCTVEGPRGEEEAVLVPCEADAGGDETGGVDGDGNGDGNRPGDGEGDGDGGGDGVRAWVNRCTHEAQRLHRGGALGAVLRGGEIVCPRHGSAFDTCTGDCDSGEAAGTALVPVPVTVEDGAVYLADEGWTFRHEGPATAGDEGADGDGDEGPDSTSHIGF